MLKYKMHTKRILLAGASLSITLIFAISGISLVHAEHAQQKITAPKASYQKLPYKELIFPLEQLLPSHAPSIVELPNGELFAAWYAATTQSPYAAIWGSRKTSASHKWSRPFIINHSPERSNKNPVLYVNKDNKLLLFWAEENRWHKWKRDRLRMKISEDLGHTWGAAQDVGSLRGFLPRTHLTDLSNGTVILPIYTDWNTSSAIVTSNDGGITWSRPHYILPFFGIQPTVIQRSDSSLFTLMRSGMWPRLAWQAVSTNYGNNWRSQRFSAVKNPGSSLEMIKLRNGHIALVFNDSKTSRESISLALSYDEGRTWTPSRAIEYRKNGVNCYPSIMQDSHGLIHVVYAYDSRKSIVHFVTDERWITEKGRVSSSKK